MKILWSYEVLKSLSSLSVNIFWIQESNRSFEDIQFSVSIEILSTEKKKSILNNKTSLLLKITAKQKEIIFVDEIYNIQLPPNCYPELILLWNSSQHFQKISSTHYTFENSKPTIQMKFSLSKSILESPITPEIPNLKFEEFLQLNCRFCSQKFIKNFSKKDLEIFKKNFKIRNLPSPYWRELADMWICGCCDSDQIKNQENSTKELLNSDIKAKTNFLLNGSNFFLVHKDQLNLEAFLIQKSKRKKKNTLEKEKDWDDLFCRRCNSLIGQRERTDNLKENEFFNFNLFKKSLSTSKNLFKNLTIESELADLISSLSENEHCFRFLIYGELEKDPLIQLSLVPTENLFHCSFYSDVSSIIQLCFRCCLSEKNEFEKSFKLWSEKNFKFESIILREEECKLLLSFLSHTCDCINQRKLNGMKVGFLRKNNFG